MNIQKLEADFNRHLRVLIFVTVLADVYGLVSNWVGTL